MDEHVVYNVLQKRRRYRDFNLLQYIQGGRYVQARQYLLYTMYTITDVWSVDEPDVYNVSQVRSGTAVYSSLYKEIDGFMLVITFVQNRE